MAFIFLFRERAKTIKYLFNYESTSSLVFISISSIAFMQG